LSEGKRKTRRQRYRPSRTHASHAIDDQHQDERHHESDDRTLSADHGPKHVIGEIGHPVECRDWNRQRPKCDRRGVGDQGHHGRLYGIEADRHQHRAADCNGHAGTRQGLIKAPKQIRDDDRLDVAGFCAFLPIGDPVGIGVERVASSLSVRLTSEAPEEDNFGIGAIVTAREICPDTPVLADTKTVDAGDLEAEMVLGEGRAS
jgi:hypothetical protein